jgi:hypothetical protein
MENKDVQKQNDRVLRFFSQQAPYRTYEMMTGMVIPKQGCDILVDKVQQDRLSRFVREVSKWPLAKAKQTSTLEFFSNFNKGKHTYFYDPARISIKDLSDEKPHPHHYEDMAPLFS